MLINTKIMKRSKLETKSSSSEEMCYVGTNLCSFNGAFETSPYTNLWICNTNLVSEVIHILSPSYVAISLVFSIVSMFCQNQFGFIIIR